MIERTDAGVAYEWGLAGPGGGWFRLLPVRGKHTAQDVAQAKVELRMKQDVIQLMVRWVDKDPEVTV